MSMNQTIDYKICEFERGFKKYLIEDINLVKFIKQGWLTFDEKLLFKHMASNIHNIITLSMTNAFVDLLEGKHTPYPGNANSNGYDLVYKSQTHPTIIAEIKSTEPSGANFYGQQITELRDDLTNLTQEKRDSRLQKGEFAKAIKVMVLLDNVKTAYKELVKNMNYVEIIETNLFKQQYDRNALNSNKIYVVFVKPKR